MSKITVGSAVSGKEFYNRIKELKRCFFYLGEKNSIIFLGIRRTGKSSLLSEIARQMAEKGWTCVTINAAQCKNSAQFYQSLYAQLPKTLQDQFKKWIVDAKAFPTRLLEFITQAIDKVKVGDNEIDFNTDLDAYTSQLEKVVGEFLQKQSQLVLFIDELPFMFENMGETSSAVAEIKSFLTTLRDWRDTKVPMAIAGSLNIHLQLDRLGISRKLLAGLNQIEVKPLDREEAKGMVEWLIADRKDASWWTVTTTEKMLDLLPDYLPFFIQKFVSELLAEVAVTDEQVEEVFHNYIHPFLLKDFLYQFEERLSKFPDEQQPKARHILTITAKQGSISTQNLEQDTELDYSTLIKLVDHELLTVNHEGDYEFTLNIVSDWWKKKVKI